MEQNRLWELIAKKIAGEASQEEMRELEALLLIYPQGSFTMEIMENYWKAGKEKGESEEREHALERHLTRLEAARSDNDQSQLIPEPANGPVSDADAMVVSGRWKHRTTWLLVAASLTIVALIGTVYKLGMPRKETVALKMKTISASLGSKNHFMLPDGSRVWLNAGTTLTYPATFYDDSVRRVTLSGEAFFEITHDENHPFVIHTERMDIRDIGTAFNVKAYPGEQIAEATLIEGSIEVKLKKSDHYTVLNTPNEKVTVYSKESKTSVTADAKQLAETADLSLVLSKARQNPTDTLLPETAWLDDVLMFSNETFEDLAVKMERWYDVKIRFNSDELRKRRFTGAFSNETVTQALQEIQLMKPFIYEIENGTITISD